MALEKKGGYIRLGMGPKFSRKSPGYSPFESFMVVLAPLSSNNFTWLMESKSQA